jgi:hypothetical protein
MILKGSDFKSEIFSNSKMAQIQKGSNTKKSNLKTVQILQRF